jgi:hypothetical protein
MTVRSHSRPRPFVQVPEVDGLPVVFPLSALDHALTIQAAQLKVRFGRDV